MSEKSARMINAAGNDGSATVEGSNPKDLLRHPLLLTEPLALECAPALFIARQGGLYASSVPIVVKLPTVKEIIVAQAAVKEVIGDRFRAATIGAPTGRASAQGRPLRVWGHTQWWRIFISDLMSAGDVGGSPLILIVETRALSVGCLRDAKRHTRSTLVRSYSH